MDTESRVGSQSGQAPGPGVRAKYLGSGQLVGKLLDLLLLLEQQLLERGERRLQLGHWGKEQVRLLEPASGLPSLQSTQLGAARLPAAGDSSADTPSAPAG